LSAHDVTTLRASERDALAAVEAIVVTSSATQRCLVEDYAVSAQRIFVAPPGSDSVTPSQGSTDGIVRLLSVGAVVPRKGFDVLIAALATIAELPWHLTIVGDRTRDRKAVAQLDADIRLHRLDDRVTVLGEVPSHHLAELYVAADAFVLASRFEGYGMAYAEAIARGLPVIGTKAGAIPETVPPGTSILVRPDNPSALAEGLRRIIEDPTERLRLGSAARAAAAHLPTWQASAKIFSRAIETVG
jgi:glycosyltransferase involved in cell wall biosynthesis